MTLYHDTPASKGVENALKRAQQMLKIRYMPVKPFPACEKIMDAQGKKSFVSTYSPAYFPAEGMVYSSARRGEKYLGYNISLETFVTALSNPNSVVYTRPIEGTGQNVHCWYGIVCSCFASYVHELHYRTSCAYWPSLEGITEVDTTKLENLRLGDLVLDVTRHIAVITDIERDVEGVVYYISVSESVMPFCRTTRFTPEEFRGYWLGGGYRVYRNANIDSITYTPNPFVPLAGDPPMSAPEINRTLMTDFGNKANYIRGEEAVELSVFDDTFDTVIVTDPDGEEAFYTVAGGKVIVKPEKIGHYSACCSGSGVHSPSVEWCVTGLTASVDKNIYTVDEEVKVHFNNPAKDRIVAYQYERYSDERGPGGYLNVTAEYGDLTIPAPTKDGKYWLYLIARNPYGDYTTRRVDLEVQAKQ